MDIYQELCDVVRDIGIQGWCQGTGGNFSAVLQQQPLQIAITKSGCNKKRLVKKDFVVINDKGEVIGDGKSSAETLLHLTIIAQVKAGSVLHTHSVWNTLLGEHFAGKGGFYIHGYEMLKGIQGIDTHRKKVFIPVLPNSQDMIQLSAQLQQLLKEHPETKGVLLAGHGLYTWGDHIHEAHRHVEIFEFLFECVGRRTQFNEFLGK